MNFRARLALARKTRQINDRVNERCPDLAYYWAQKNRRDRVRSHMVPVRQGIGYDD